MNIKKVVIVVAIAGILFSCENNEPDLPKGDFDRGFLVTNEGAFSGGTGTVNFISDDFTVEEEKVYNRVNNESIGTVLQSAGFYNDAIYLIANVGNKISVANRYSMKKVTEINTDLSNPRYIAFANGKAFVTNWGDGATSTDDYVAVINLETYTVESKISVVEGPEQIITDGNTLYVSHKGGWNSGNSVTAIDATNNSVITNIEVGDIPDELAIDNNGNLLVSCEGKALAPWNPTEVLGSLVKINTATNEVLSTITFESGFHPNIMTFSDANIYISTGSAIYEMSQNATEVPTSSILNTTVSGLAVKGNRIYVTDVKDFTVNGTLTVFDRSTKSLIKEFTVGLIPRKIYFN